MNVKYISFLQKRIATNELEVLAHYFDLLNEGEQDHKQFKLYLQSPFFNKDKRLIHLYELLIRAEKNESTHLNAKTIISKWKQLSSKAADVDLILKKIKQLKQHILDYYAHQQIKSNKKDRYEILHRRFNNQGVPFILDKIKAERTKLISAQGQGMQQLIDRYLMSHLAYYDQDINHIHKGLELMLELQQELHNFQTSMNIIYTAELQNIQRVISKQTVKIVSDNGKLLAHSILQELFSLSLKNYDEHGHFQKENFHQFCTLLLEKQTQLDEQTRFILCKHIVNVFSALVNHGIPNYEKELLQWLKRRQAWTPSSLAKMDPNEFLNLVITSAHCGDITFARQYIADDGHKLPANEAIYAIQLSEAFCCFYEKDYTQTRSILREYFKRYSVQHYKYTLRSKTLLIRACLCDELNGHDAYEEFLKTKEDFRIYLQRLDSKVPANYFESYKNFLVLCNDIFLAQKQFKDESRLDQKKKFALLKKKIDNTQIIVCKKWLTEVVNDQLN